MSRAQAFGLRVYVFGVCSVGFRVLECFKEKTLTA